MALTDSTKNSLNTAIDTIIAFITKQPDNDILQDLIIKLTNIANNRQIQRPSAQLGILGIPNSPNRFDALMHMEETCDTITPNDIAFEECSNGSTDTNLSKCTYTPDEDAGMSTAPPPPPEPEFCSKLAINNGNNYSNSDAANQQDHVKNPGQNTRTTNRNKEIIFHPTRQDTSFPTNKKDFTRKLRNGKVINKLIPSSPSSTESHSAANPDESQISPINSHSATTQTPDNSPASSPLTEKEETAVSLSLAHHIPHSGAPQPVAPSRKNEEASNGPTLDDHILTNSAPISEITNEDGLAINLAMKTHNYTSMKDFNDLAMTLQNTQTQLMNPMRLKPAFPKSTLIPNPIIKRHPDATIPPTSSANSHLCNENSFELTQNNAESASFNQDDENPFINSPAYTPSLAATNQETLRQKLQKNKEKTSPIIIEDPNHSWADITKLIKNKDFTAHQAGKNKFNIKPTNVEEYRSIQQTLIDNKIYFHSHPLPADKNLKVVIRNLPHDTNTADIANELTEDGLTILKVSQLSRKTENGKINLPLFLVELPKHEKSYEIYNYKFLLQLKIKIEEYKGRKGIPQCHNCQGFFHAQANCNKPPRCVKCAQNHHTRDCTKPRETPPKCYNCGGEHPANFTGCPNFPTETQSTNNPPPAPSNNGRTFTSRYITNRSWANVVNLIPDTETNDDQGSIEDRQHPPLSNTVILKFLEAVDWLKSSDALTKISEFNQAYYKINNPQPHNV